MIAALSSSRIGYDVVITGGFNVYPNDVEAVLGQHPDVSECVVFGLPDEKWGESVHAAVELSKTADLMRRL